MILHINPVVGRTMLMHGKRGCFQITRYANGFEIWRQTHTPDAMPAPMDWLLASGAATKIA